MSFEALVAGCWLNRMQDDAMIKTAHWKEQFCQACHASSDLQAPFSTYMHAHIHGYLPLCLPVCVCTDMRSTTTNVLLYFVRPMTQ